MSDWDAPADSEFFTIKDHIGSLCIFAINEFIPQLQTAMGIRDTIRAEIVVIAGPNAGKRYTDGLLFGAKLVPQLKSKVGGIVLGKIVQGQAKAGQSAPYLLQPATDEDKAIANKFVEVNGAVVPNPTTTRQAAPAQANGAPSDWRSNGGQSPQGYPNQGPPPRQGQPAFSGPNSYTDEPPY